MRRIAYLATEKTCKICCETLSIDNFRKRIKGDRVSYEPYCLECEYNLNLNKSKIYAKIRRKIDPGYCLRKNISFSIWYALKLSNSSKNNESCMKYLPYSINELKQHLESLFESWMTWNNYGTFISDVWTDNDPKTWTWQLDHIIPQSDLPYTSMTDDNFKKC